MALTKGQPGDPDPIKMQQLEADLATPIFWAGPKGQNYRRKAASYCAQWRQSLQVPNMGLTVRQVRAAEKQLNWNDRTRATHTYLEQQQDGATPMRLVHPRQEDPTVPPPTPALPPSPPDYLAVLQAYLALPESVPLPDYTPQALMALFGIGESAFSHWVETLEGWPAPCTEKRGQKHFKEWRARDVARFATDPITSPRLRRVLAAIYAGVRPSRALAKGQADRLDEVERRLAVVEAVLLARGEQVG